MDWYIKNKYKGLVLEGFGLGHVPTSTINKKDSWIPKIKDAIDNGITVVISTQTIFGRVNPFVYRNLRLVYKTGALYGENVGGFDMPAELALIKLGWVLGHTKDKEKIKEMMETNYAGEINQRGTMW